MMHSMSFNIQTLNVLSLEKKFTKNVYYTETDRHGSCFDSNSFLDKTVSKTSNFHLRDRFSPVVR